VGSTYTYGRVGDRFISPFEYVTPSPYAQRLSLDEEGQNRGRNVGRSVSRYYWPEDENDNGNRDGREVSGAFPGSSEMGQDLQYTPSADIRSIDSKKVLGRSSRGRLRTATTLDFDTSYKVKPYAPRVAGAGSGSDGGFESVVVSPLQEDSAAAYARSGRSNSMGESSYKDKDRKQAPYTPHVRDSTDAGGDRDRDRFKTFNVRRWKEEEDQALQAAVEEVDSRVGYRDWHAVSRAVHGRNAKQCRERWLSQLAPSINREPWTAQEEKVLIQAHHDFGNKWTDIAKLLPGRTDNSVKNQWKSIKRRMESNTALSAKKRKNMEKQYGGYYTTLAVLPPKVVPTVTASAAGGSRSRSSSTASDNTIGTDDTPDSARSNESNDTAAAAANAVHHGRAVSPTLPTFSSPAAASGANPDPNANDDARERERERGYYGDEEEATRSASARQGSEGVDVNEPPTKRRRSLSH
jgi:hypothetical protein